MPARPLLALVTATMMIASGLALGGAASAAPSAPARVAVTPAPGGYVPPALDWGACPKGEFPSDFQCGHVIVPLDWNDVGGATISIAVTRVVHTTKRYQGVMLVNPGGPGGSGTIFPLLRESVPKKAGDTYDWIGFDPRGVGDSKPALSCVPSFFKGPRPAYIPTTKSIERSWITRSKGYAAACAAKNGALLAHMTTAETVKDMDAIRVALGQEQINYFGYSYGTYLGQVYGTLFPSHLRRAVFDSNVDPRSVWYQANNDQDIAFEKVARVYFGWVAKYDRIYHLGKTEAAVTKAYYAVRDSLDKHPVGSIGGDEWSDSLLPAGYSQSSWPDLTQFFSDYVVKHSTKALKTLYADYGAVPDDNGFAVYTAVECNESQWPPSYVAYRADQRRINRVAPFLTWGNAWYNAACLYWPLPYQPPVEVDGSKVTSALLIDETLDAATPISGSFEVRRRFPNSVLLAEPGGTSHASSLGGNACVDDTIAAYLKDGTLPVRKSGSGADKLCAPLPQPKPTQLTKGGSSSGSSKGSMASRYLLHAGLLR